MIKSSEKYQKWARNVIGEKLSSVKGLIYFFKAPDFEHPQQLQLIFSNISNVTSFKCGKDGSTLELTDNPMQEKNLGEYGEEIILDISHTPSLINFIGKTLLKIYVAFSFTEDSYVGIKLSFEGEKSFVIANIGDEINILDSFPSSYEEVEGINYQEL